MSKPKIYDFSGWATKNDLKCSDGRTIRHNAFKDDDGKRVSLVWMHQHDDPVNVLGHADLENRPDGVYAYCSLNDTPGGRQVREIIKHGDVTSLSIWANGLTQERGNVLHGSIKEVSVVLAGANPGAVIDYPILAHGEESETEAYIRVDEPIEIFHSDDDGETAGEPETPENENLAHADEPAAAPAEEGGKERTIQDVLDEMTEEERAVTEFLVEQAIASREEADEESAPAPEAAHSAISPLTPWKRNATVATDTLAHAEEGAPANPAGEGRTVQDVLDGMTEEKRMVVEYLVSQALEGNDEEEPTTEGGEVAAHNDDEGEVLHMNVFEQNGNEKATHPVLSHAEAADMLKYASDNHISSLKQLYLGWAQENGINEDELSHADLGINNIATLFPDHKLLNGLEPEPLTTDQGWITKVLAKVKKSPMSRVKVRFADVRDISGRRANGYTKQQQKELAGNIDLLGRDVNPTTVYISSKLDRDDIVDITDFNVVNYMYNLDKMNLNEELARQIMIGDGRTGNKAIDPTKIKPIWTDDELFCIHSVVDVQSMRTTMNGSDSSANFGDNYVYAEAVLQSLLYAREKYKGSGNPDFYCTPHLVNIMLLARDLNGRRIYDNVSDLTAALNVNSIITAEQFEGKTRTVTVKDDKDQDVVQTRGLLGILVNLSDYEVGATKGGEITHFTDFDIRYNQEISLIETRCSGMLTRPFSAIALEEVKTST